MIEILEQRQIIDRRLILEDIENLRLNHSDEIIRRKKIYTRLQDALEKGRAEVRLRFKSG